MKMRGEGLLRQDGVEKIQFKYIYTTIYKYDPFVKLFFISH